MPIQILDVKPSVIIPPFTIAPWTGTSQLTNAYYVKRGVALRSFDYATGSFIPIRGIENTPFDFKLNHKFYIEFDILPNLQVSGAAIKCGRVGSQDPNSVTVTNPTDWPVYPQMIYTTPRDVYDPNGRIRILRNGKRQRKCYALIGYRSDDQEPNGQSYGDQNADTAFSGIGNTGVGGFVPIQCLDRDIIMMHVAVNGVPCVVPMPYFNATNHYNLVAAP